MLTTYHTLGTKRQSPRIWLESTRLLGLGFSPKTFLTVQPHLGHSLVIRPASGPTRNRISAKHIAFLPCPIIDINSRETLGMLAGYDEVKLTGSYHQLILAPSQRAFNIATHRQRGLPIRTIEYFAGGSTMTAALTSDPRFSVEAAVEIEPRYAAHFDQQHPYIPLFQCDIRQLNPQDLPLAGYMHASIPCNCFSTAGTAKNQLKGQRELGDTGDLFLPLVHHIATHFPLAVTVECVNAFFTSLAGLTFGEHLRRLGYHITQIDLKPHEEWAEPQDRKRGLLVATWPAKFYPSIPMTPFQGTLERFLDPPHAEKDAHEAQQIARMIEGRRRHMDRHRATGNHFGFSTINYASPRCPTITKNSWKINGGPFVDTPYGLRMLRQEEIQRLMGYEPKGGLTSQHYDTAVQILGQGVQTRVFKQLIQQLGDFLQYHLEGHVSRAEPETHPTKNA